jgi:cell division protein FtsB
MNTKQLREVIFKEIEDLNNGESTKEKAAAIARLAGSSIAAKKLEVQVAKFRIESGKTEGAVDL